MFFKVGVFYFRWESFYFVFDVLFLDHPSNPLLPKKEPRAFVFPRFPLISPSTSSFLLDLFSVFSPFFERRGEGGRVRYKEMQHDSIKMMMMQCLLMIATSVVITTTLMTFTGYGIRSNSPPSPSVRGISETERMRTMHDSDRTLREEEEKEEASKRMMEEVLSRMEYSHNRSISIGMEMLERVRTWMAREDTEKPKPQGDATLSEKDTGKGLKEDTKKPSNHASCHNEILSCKDGLGPSSSLQEETSRLLLETVRKDTKCNDERRWGGGSSRGEGAWTLCMDGFPSRGSSCVVYSIGINHDFSFDEEAQRETGCEVHSFDPSMGWGDRRRGDRSWFWNVGVSDKDEDRNSKGWRMRTLGSMMRGLNHTRIDVLKMDVEGYEWDSLSQAMKDGTLSRVDRLMVEIHFWSPRHDIETHHRWRRVLSSLREHGLRLHSFRENPMSSSSETGFRNVMSCCFELSFVREGGRSSL